MRALKKYKTYTLKSLILKHRSVAAAAAHIGVHRNTLENEMNRRGVGCRKMAWVRAMTDSDLLAVVHEAGDTTKAAKRLCVCPWRFRSELKSRDLMFNPHLTVSVRSDDELVAALIQSDGEFRRAAKMLGTKRQTLQRAMFDRGLLRVPGPKMRSVLA